MPIITAFGMSSLIAILKAKDKVQSGAAAQPDAAAAVTQPGQPAAPPAAAQPGAAVQQLGAAAAAAELGAATAQPGAAAAAELGAAAAAEPEQPGAVAAQFNDLSAVAAGPPMAGGSALVIHVAT